MKTHVLTFSKSFMKDHPKSGEPTEFREKVIKGKKIHTIRSNYDWWATKIEEVQMGDARLSLRYWKGKPYRSKQQEFLGITEDDNPGVQKIAIKDNIADVWPRSNRSASQITEIVSPGIHILAENDGLGKHDFLAWFDQPFEGIIIHFTSYRY